MALPSVCGNLINGQNNACANPLRGFAQQLVLINKSDILTPVINTPTAESETCVYNASFVLKDGATGVRFTGVDGGSVYKGYFAKSNNDYGMPQYVHSVQILVLGSTEEAMCILDAVSKGLYVAALQIGDDVVIYGLQSGLAAADYTYDIVDGGGGSLIVLESRENNPEGLAPLIYNPGVGGDAIADFDSNFAAPVTP